MPDSERKLNELLASLRNRKPEEGTNHELYTDKMHGCHPERERERQKYELSNWRYHNHAGTNIYLDIVIRN